MAVLLFFNLDFETPDGCLVFLSFYLILVVDLLDSVVLDLSFVKLALHLVVLDNVLIHFFLQGVASFLGCYFLLFQVLAESMPFLEEIELLCQVVKGLLGLTVLPGFCQKCVEFDGHLLGFLEAIVVLGDKSLLLVGQLIDLDFHLFYSVLQQVELSEVGVIGGLILPHSTDLVGFATVLVVLQLLVLSPEVRDFLD
jgi:ethanolamine transporter EutH